MVLPIGDRPDPRLTGKLRKEGVTATPLRKAFARLKRQWGLDAKDVRLNIKTNEDVQAGNVAGSFNSGTNTITLFMPLITSHANIVAPSKNKFTVFAGKSLETLTQSVLRHEFAHAMQMNREARTGVSDDQIDPSGLRVYGGDPKGGHGMTFNRLNVAVQGFGSEVGRPHIGLPPELQVLFDRRKEL